MKTQLGLLACALALSSPAGYALTAPAPTPTPLQITVTVPASVNLIRSDDLAETLAATVADEFRRDGFTGPMNYLSWADTPKADAPKLELNLITWRHSITQFIDCTFSAQLVTATGTHDLGLVSGTTIGMASRYDWFGRGDEFIDAASDAAHQLYQEIATQKLLPAFHS